MSPLDRRTDVEIVEVAPRDGFQPIGPFIETVTKIDVVRRLHAAGLRRIEIGSFVSASAVPQMADTPAVLDGVRGEAGLLPQLLVPTERRGADALAAGAPMVAYVLSVSEAHNRNNVRRTPAESAPTTSVSRRACRPIRPCASASPPRSTARSTAASSRRM